MTDTASKKERRAKHFIWAAFVGGPAFAVVFGAVFLFPQPDVPKAIHIFGQTMGLIAIISLVLVILYRNTDEYTTSLWHAAVSATFIIAVIFGFFGTGVEIAIYQFVLGIDPEKIDFYVSDALNFSLMILVFFGTITLRHVVQSKGGGA